MIGNGGTYLQLVLETNKRSHSFHFINLCVRTLFEALPFFHDVQCREYGGGEEDSKNPSELSKVHTHHVLRTCNEESIMRAG